MRSPAAPPPGRSAPAAAPARGWRRWVRAWALACCAALLAACASVPDAQERAARKAQAGLSTDAAQDSYRRGQAIAADPRNASRDFLARHLAVEEAVSGAPLTAGNRDRKSVV